MLTIAFLLGAAGSAFGETLPACLQPSGGARVLVDIVDPETLRLDDGSEIHLVGALPPLPPKGAAKDVPWSPLVTYERMLESFVGRSIRLSPEKLVRDRWGRRPAQVIVGAGSEARWLQGHLVALGLARAYGLPEADACASELVAMEDAPRAAAKGLWTSPAYALRQAADSGAIAREVGRFTVVAGGVVRVAKVRGATFLNFGPCWQTDFTAVIASGIRRVLERARWDERRVG